MFKPRIRSRHPSHSSLRNMLPLLPFRSVVRMGSTTDVEETISRGGRIIEINTIEAIKNSASKLRMKNCFTLGGVKTPEWFTMNEKREFFQVMGAEQAPVTIALDKLPYPIVVKHIYGSRGTGNYKLDDQVALQAFIKNRIKNVTEYIFEKFYNYGREYRLHITEDGCFYTCRKALKKDAAKDAAWQRHDDNCVWFIETNASFDKPANWEEIVAECVKALNATELDIASFDVRVQNSTTGKGKAREKCEFVVIECNSASSFGDDAPNTFVCKKYLETIPAVAKKKAIEYGVIRKA